MRFFRKNTFLARAFSAMALLGSVLLTSSRFSPAHAGIRLKELKTGAEQSTQALPESGALAFLNRFSEITIPITPAPGNGHYAAGRLVMDRLRDLGYQGKFKIYIDRRARSLVPHFLPGYDPAGPENQVLKSLNAETFVFEAIHPKTNNELKTYIGAPFQTEDFKASEVKSLAIMGADDYGISPANVNTDALLVVQPTGWAATSELRVTKPNSRDGYYYSMQLLEESSLKLHDVVPRPINPVEFVKNHMDGYGTAEMKSPGVQEMVKVIDQHESLGAYGLSYQEGPKKFATALGAIDEVRQSGKVALRSGTIVPMFSNFNEAEWKNFHINLDPKYRSKVKIVSITDADLGQSLKSLAKDEILVVKTGHLPQDVFNYLMAKSTFPPMISGTTGSAYVAKLGRPFFNTVNQANSTSRETAIHLRGAFSALENGHVDKVANYMISARDPNSQIWRDFQLYAKSAKQGKEKVLGILEKVTSESCYVKLLKSAVPEAVESAQMRKAIDPLAQTLLGP